MKTEIDYLCNYNDIEIIDITPLVGEPLLHPNIEEIITYILSNNKKVYIISSLSVKLNDALLNILKHPNIILFCSLYGDNDNLYIKYTNTNSYKIVEKNFDFILLF